MKRMSRKEAIRQGMVLGSAALLGGSMQAFGSPSTAGRGDRTAAGFTDRTAAGRADWLAGKWGLMTHWIAPGPGSETGHRITDLNAAVDAFDVPAFIRQFEATGAHHLIFTVGQNTTYYSSPNAVMDKYMGPGHCPRRDLVLEIAR